MAPMAPVIPTAPSGPPSGVANRGHVRSEPRGDARGGGGAGDGDSSYKGLRRVRAIVTPAYADRGSGPTDHGPGPAASGGEPGGAGAGARA